MPGSVGAPVGRIQTFIGITTNAGKARFRGLEFKGNLVACNAFISGARLGLQVAAGDIDAKYTQFIEPRGIDVASRRAIQNTSELTIPETLSYNVPNGSGALNASTTLSYRGDAQQFELRIPGLDQPCSALLDGGLAYTAENDRWSIGIQGRNLT